MQLAKGQPATVSLDVDPAEDKDGDELDGSSGYPSQDRWAAVEMKGIAAGRLLDILERRFDGPVEGVMTGVQYLLFGPTISLERVTGFEWDDQQTTPPSVSLSELLDRAPRYITTTLEGTDKTYSNQYPVTVGQTQAQLQ